MKKTLNLIAALAVLTAAGASLYALDSQKFTVPSDANYAKVAEADVYGLAVSSKSAAGTVTPNIKGSNTAIKLWASARGIFYDAWLSSGSASNYCVFFDSAAPKAITSWDDPEIVLLGVAFRGTTASWESSIPGAAAVDAGYARGERLPREFRNGLASICTDDNVYFPVFRKADD